jgi:opacity protein-like surface antigen
MIGNNSFGEELKENTNYRSRTIIDASEDASTYDKKVGAQSKFVVIDNDDKDKYAIKFLNVYQVGEIKSVRTESDYKDYKPSDVIEDQIYFLKKDEVNGVPIEKKVHQSFGGLVSGPLVVPFKYRTSDDSISGEATVGYYAGWGWDTNFFGASDRYVTFTPFLSAGLTQVAVTTVDENQETSTDNKSGFSWATGILINNWDSVNIGVVYGEDRIGDKEWEHEGDGWLSISIGWEIK